MRRSDEGPRNGVASPESQIRHMIICLQVKEDEIASLKLDLRTLQLEREKEQMDAKKGFAELFSLYQRCREAESRQEIKYWPQPIVKRPWWCFWGKKL